MDYETLKSNFEIELKRGIISLAVLSLLKEKQYGYSLLEALLNININIEAGTLYPMLRRLESQGILESTWDTEETRPRKYYSLSSIGKDLLKDLKEIYKSMSEDVDKWL